MTASITFQADHVEVKGLFGQALCSASGFGAHVGVGSWLCENSSARRARRNISKKLRNMESNRAACTMLDTLSENCIFYISPMYEFSHRLGQSRRTTMFAMSGLAPIAAMMLQCRDRSKSATSGCEQMQQASVQGSQTYSITSSARASSAAGTSRPSALAVVRFMMNSNLAACITGRSTGFSPLRMRPV